MDGEDITRLAVSERARKGIARSFQVTSLCLEFTALENVALAIQAHQGHSYRMWGRARDDESLVKPARKLLDTVGLAERTGVPAGLLAHAGLAFDAIVLAAGIQVTTDGKVAPGGKAADGTPPDGAAADDTATDGAPTPQADPSAPAAILAGLVPVPLAAPPPTPTVTPGVKADAGIAAAGIAAAGVAAASNAGSTAANNAANEVAAYLGHFRPSRVGVSKLAVELG